MNTLMAIPVIFFTAVMVVFGLPWLFLHLVFPGNWSREPRPARQLYYCKGSAFSGTPYPRGEGAHTHKIYAEAQACGERWVAAEEARNRWQGPDIPCPVCHHNHFSPECPPGEPAGARVVNARTGEVVGYWRGRDAQPPA